MVEEVREYVFHEQQKDGSMKIVRVEEKDLKPDDYALLLGQLYQFYLQAPQRTKDEFIKKIAK